MRYVDNEALVLPDGWEQRAETALNELREEIAQAEVSARAAGSDVAVARKQAIAAGLRVPARENLWRALKSALAALTDGKCWYSESRDVTADKEIDHFRPKSSVREDASHEGYWWLAFQWRNYRYASQWANQRRVDQESQTAGGKWDHFPVCEGSFRARLETDDYEAEQPELLDPIDPDDWRLLTFRQDGHPTAVREAGSLEHQRAHTSIELYHLECYELVRARRALAIEVQLIVQDMDRLLLENGNATMRILYKRRQKDLLRKIGWRSEYSAAAVAFVRSEVWTVVQGRRVKRPWLEEMLML